MACTDPVHAHLVWLGDYLASRGRNPDMVNEWTRDDLPETLLVFQLGNYRTAYFDAQVRDALAKHLNANHPKPEHVDASSLLRGTLNRAVAERDQARSERDEAVARADDYDSTYELWRRAHALVEQERDRAICERHEAVRDRDLWEGKYLDADEARHRMERERDEQEDDATRAACERAEQAERDRDEWKARAEARSPLDMTVRDLIIEIANGARNGL